ncbi:unnamed protein product, partial [marine sediment metagenome]
AIFHASFPLNFSNAALIEFFEQTETMWMAPSWFKTFFIQ